MWPLIGAVALFVLLALLLVGERAFERGRDRARRRLRALRDRRDRS